MFCRRAARAYRWANYRRMAISWPDWTVTICWPPIYPPIRPLAVRMRWTDRTPNCQTNWFYPICLVQTAASSPRRRFAVWSVVIRAAANTTVFRWVYRYKSALFCWVICDWKPGFALKLHKHLFKASRYQSIDLLIFWSSSHRPAMDARASLSEAYVVSWSIGRLPLGVLNLEI